MYVIIISVPYQTAFMLLITTNLHFFILSCFNLEFSTLLVAHQSYTLTRYFDSKKKIQADEVRRKNFAMIKIVQRRKI